MTDRLSLYNGALEKIGDRQLASLTEDREPRYKLDDVWNRNAVKRCLQRGLWNFATRTQRMDFDPSITPAFGYQYAFQKPSDWLRTAAFSADEYFSEPWLHYTDESGYWWCDLEQVYIRYISDDNQYGNDLSIWPENFTEYVEWYLGWRVLPSLTHLSTKREEVKKDMRDALTEAKATDAMDENMKRIPPGNWGQSRRGRGGSGWDRGSRNRLLG